MSKKITLEGLDHFKDKENAMIAGKPESTNTATVAHAVGEYFYWKGVLHIVTAAIAVGGTIQTNTNVKPAVLADDVSDLKESITEYIGTPDLKTGGYILNDGKLHTDGGANDRYSQFIPVKKGNIIDVFARGNSNTNSISFYTSESESSYVEGIANNRSTHVTYNVGQDGYVRFYFTVSAAELVTTSIDIFSNSEIYEDEKRKINLSGKEILPYSFRFGFWQNRVYYFDLTHYCSSDTITVTSPIEVFAEENLRCDWDFMENGSVARTYRITSDNSPITIPSGTYYVNVTKTSGGNVTIDDIRFGMTKKILLQTEIDEIETTQLDLRFNEMFSRRAILSLGNFPQFSNSGTDIILTFSGNVLVTKKLSNSELYNYSGLGGTYTVPNSSYCVINLTSGEVQVKDSATLFASTDEYVVLFFNHYGYPKFGWEMYWNKQNTENIVYDNLTKYPYSGEKITLQNSLSYSKMFSMSKGYSQGGACYGNYLFQFHSQDQLEEEDFHGCTVSNLKDRKEIQFIDLGYDVTKHNNNASFGSIKYSESDNFPLLYVSQESSDARSCIVYRITETGNTSAPYALTAVQTINFPIASAWDVVYSNACVGDDGYLYVLGYQGSDTYELLKYSTPSISESTVQLVYDNAISTVSITIDTNAQGFMVYDGKLYVTAGGSSYAILQVNSLSDGTQLTKVNFNNVGLPYEPEALFLFNKTLCVSFATNGCTVYRFNF